MDTKTVEERLVTLEKQTESLSIVLHQFVKTLQEIKANSADVSNHVAALLRTIFDSRPLSKEGLAESSVLNSVDKLNHYLASAVKSGIIEPSTGAVETNSLIVAQQFDAQHNEINRRVLLNASDMKPEDKSLFEGKLVGEELTGFSEAPEAIILIHEVYSPVQKMEKKL